MKKTFLQQKNALERLRCAYKGEQLKQAVIMLKLSFCTSYFSILGNPSKECKYLKTSKQSVPERVSLILWECPNTGGWSVGLLKGKRRRRGEMTGKEGKMSSSIKSPYVYSLSSTLAPGIRAG